MYFSKITLTDQLIDCVGMLKRALNAWPFKKVVPNIADLQTLGVEVYALLVSGDSEAVPFLNMLK